MKICIESQLLNHHQRSGVLTYTEGLINSIERFDRNNNYDLLFYSLRRRTEEMPGPQGGHMRKAIVRVPDQVFKGRQFLIDRLFLPSYFRREKIQVFHRPSGYTMPLVKNVFNVLTVHDLRTLTIGDVAWRQNIGNYKKTLHALDFCVVVSECTKQDLLKHFQMDEKKIKVIYLGADKRFTVIEKAAVEAVKTKYGINKPFLLSVGSVPRKNIDGILKGFAATKAKQDFLLVLSCHTDFEKYRQMAVDLGVADKILILNSLSDNDLVALYNGCHAFVFPSLYEGFGLPILEAMQCAAPVITSNMSSCPEVAGDAAVLVDPLAIGEITQAIDQICFNETLRQSYIQKGFERCQLFNWDNYAREITKVYALAG